MQSHSSFQPEAFTDRPDNLAVICHELRNSLAIISGAVRLLRSPESATMHRAGQVIERHMGQMARHVDDLLEPLHRTRDLQGLVLSRVDLREIARYAADAIASEMVRRGHHLVLDFPTDAVWVRADRARLEQVFSNLLINAAKYTPDGGDIALRIECAGEIVRVRVRDSGVGIPPALLLRVFGMFVQGDVAPPGVVGGHGIGLAVVRAVVELHGGSVTAASEGLGRGSEFTVALPVLSALSGPMIVTP